MGGGGDVCLHTYLQGIDKVKFRGLWYNMGHEIQWSFKKHRTFNFLYRAIVGDNASRD